MVVRRPSVRAPRVHRRERPSYFAPFKGGRLRRKRPVRRVSTSFARVLPGARLDDIATLQLQFDPPAIGVLVASWVLSGGFPGIRIRLHGSAGLGEDMRLRGDRVVGSGLEHEHELIQLCAFSTDGADGPHTRVARPSRRR